MIFMPVNNIHQKLHFRASSCLFFSTLGMEGKNLLTRSHFPPGFRFHPTDQELINCYLSKKVSSSLPSDWDVVADIDIYKSNPWDLPGKACFGEGEWFFFTPRERKYPNGVRPNRSAGCGYWKATGTDKAILSAGGTQCIGVKKALVFYKGKPPKGTKTDWVMHEYRVLDSPAVCSQSKKQKGSMRLDDWVLCRVRKKGSQPAGTDDVADNCSPAQSVTISARSEAQLGMEISCFADWNDNQFLAFLLDSHQEKESIEDISNPDSVMRYSNFDGVGGDYLEIPSVFGSTKRRLSFGLLDEFVQPEKKLQSSPDALLSMANSISFCQGFPEFLE